MKQLLVSALGENQPEVINALCQLVSKCHCNILDCRISTLGSEFAGSILLGGSWNAIAKLEASLPALAHKYKLQVHAKRTEPKAYTEVFLPYSIYIVALDKPGVIYKITDFLATENIDIFELNCTTYTAKQTSAPMLTLNMSINVPADIHIANFRERFMLFCDDHNLDAIMEPEKG